MNTQVKSAGRVLDVLEFIASQDRPIFLRDVTAALAIPKSSAHMLLSTLCSRGYLIGSAGSGFQLATELATAPGWVGGHLRLITRIALPVMEGLVTELLETAALGVLTPEFDVRVVTYRNSPVEVRYDMSDTALLPGYCSAMGHLLLAYCDKADVKSYLDSTELEPLTPKTLTSTPAIQRRLRQVRNRGYSVHIDERLMGASGAAAPIIGPDGRIIAALNISTVTPRFQKKRALIIERVCAAARHVEDEAFGGRASRRRRALD